MKDLFAEEDLAMAEANKEKFSVDMLRLIVEQKSARFAYWESDDEIFEPLAIDMQTANVCIKVLEVLKEETRNKIISLMEKERWRFGQFVDKAWGAVK